MYDKNSHPENYPTWNVAMWISNEESAYHEVGEIAREILEKSHTPILEMAEWLKSYIEENNPIADEASMYNDILGYALKEVDWMRISENIIDWVREE